MRRVAYLPVTASLGFSPSIHPSAGPSTPAATPDATTLATLGQLGPKCKIFIFLGAALEFEGECRWRRARGCCLRASAGVDRRRDASCSPSRTTLTQSERERGIVSILAKSMPLAAATAVFSLSRWCTWLAWLMASVRASGPIMRYVVWGRAPVR